MQAFAIEDQAAEAARLPYFHDVDSKTNRYKCRKLAMCELRVKRLGRGQSRRCSTTCRGVCQPEDALRRLHRLVPRAHVPSIDLLVQRSLRDVCNVALEDSRIGQLRADRAYSLLQVGVWNQDALIEAWPNVLAQLSCRDPGCDVCGVNPITNDRTPSPPTRNGKESRRD